MKQKHNPAEQGYERSVFKWDEMSEFAQKNIDRLNDVYRNKDGEVFRWPHGYYWYKRGKAKAKPKKAKKVVRDINVQSVRPAIRHRDNRRSCLIAIAIIILFFALAWVAGWIAATFEKVEYISPVEEIRDINISPITLTQEEWDWYLREGLVIGAKKAHAAEEAEPTVEELIVRYFGKDADMALRIAYCESRYNPLAKNKNSSASGVFQIIKATWISNRAAMGLDTDLDLRFNAEENIKTAAYIHSRRGWQPWVCK
jgi:soluble lytic murein transglycosylase-like protein